MPPRDCDACGGPLSRVYIFDRGENQQIVSLGMDYTTDPPNQSIWSGKIRNHAGVIHPYVCGTCNKVTFYAHPGERSRS